MMCGYVVLPQMSGSVLAPNFRDKAGKRKEKMVPKHFANFSFHQLAI
jgi:hypothetical protein